MQHFFNCPFQLTRLPSPENFKDLEEAGLTTLVNAAKRYNAAQIDGPEAASFIQYDVKPGDIIVSGSDGLFDNLFEHEICAELKKAMRKEAFDFEARAAEILVQKSIEVGFNNAARSPFSVGARKAGLKHNGGKLDDTTVLVSSIMFADL